MLDTHFIRTMPGIWMDHNQFPQRAFTIAIYIHQIFLDEPCDDTFLLIRITIIKYTYFQWIQDQFLDKVINRVFLMIQFQFIFIINFPEKQSFCADIWFHDKRVMKAMLLK